MLAFIFIFTLLGLTAFLLAIQFASSIFLLYTRFKNPPLTQDILATETGFMRSGLLFALQLAIAFQLLVNNFPHFYLTVLRLPLLLGFVFLALSTFLLRNLTRGSQSISSYFFLALSSLLSLYFLATFFSFSVDNTVYVINSTITYSLSTLLNNPVQWYTTGILLSSSLLLGALYLSYTLINAQFFAKLAAGLSLITLLLTFAAHSTLKNYVFMDALWQLHPFIVGASFLFYVAAFFTPWLKPALRQILHYLIFLTLIFTYLYAMLPFIIRPFIIVGDLNSTQSLLALVWIIVSTIAGVLFLLGRRLKTVSLE